ncbi:hypothetical protein BBJ28_00001235 [Nothophytophthora sp. Chile5]|nr:hypothetical protein BBJ28_00001235 [Nothophytophthora sp. Chile5]
MPLGSISPVRSITLEDGSRIWDSALATLDEMGNSLVRVNGKVYEVLGSLGEGGFAHVYEVRRDGRHFALKWTRRVTEGEDLERLLLEIQVQRRLVHPNVLALTAAEVRRRQSSSTAEAVALYSTTRQLQDQSRFAFDGTVEKEVLMLFPIASRGSLQSFLDEAARKRPWLFSSDTSSPQRALVWRF